MAQVEILLRGIGHEVVVVDDLVDLVFIFGEFILVFLHQLGFSFDDFVQLVLVALG